MTSTKVTFLGNSSSGKTTVCYKLLGAFSAANVISPTLGVEVHSYRSNGKCYNIWDTAGKKSYEGLRDGYYLQTKIAFIFHGGEANRTPEQWENDLRNVSPDAQIYHIEGTLEEKYVKVGEILG